MPSPPDLFAEHDLRFITNYYLAGCGPAPHLVVEFSQEPSLDLLKLFIIPDYSDIGQAIFEPKSGRRRKPARHGRKRRRGRGIPDPSDIIGQRVRGFINPGDIFRLTPLVYAFRIWNVWEGVNFTAAVVEGITDVGFEHLWGIMNVDNNHCREFPRLSKSGEPSYSVGGAGPYLQPFGITEIDFNNNFVTTAWSCRTFAMDFVVVVKAYIFNGRYDQGASGNLALRNDATGEYKEQGRFNLGSREGITLQISIDAKAGQWVTWGMSGMSGFVDIYDSRILAFGLVPFPWQ